MNINDRIKELEQAIEIERVEVDRLCQISLEQNMQFSKNIELINRSQDLDRTLNELYKLKNVKASF